MVHFILLFCVLLRKREYVTTNIEDGIISRMKPNKKHIYVKARLEYL